MNIPGFVDLQVNGYRRVNFSSPRLTDESFARACDDVLEQGAAAFLPTMITCTDDVYEQNLKIISSVIASPQYRRRVPGIHVEGPFLSRKSGAIGAHNPQWVKKPDVGFLEKMQVWAGGHLKLITLAAEAKGADVLARHAVDMGIAVSLGHQSAAPENLELLTRVGATAITHLGNGMPNKVHRHNNALLYGLAADDLTAMIITDGYHLPAHLIKVIIRTKGVDKIIVTSDAAPLAGLEPGTYQSMGNLAILEESGLLHNPEKKCLVGSSATILQCMNHLASLHLLTLPELLKVGFYNPLTLINIEPQTLQAPTSLAFDDTKGIFKIAE